jgi:murein DD-endopeptidase MepM/ murein hydrolase activator NlpD
MRSVLALGAVLAAAAAVYAWLLPPRDRYVLALEVRAIVDSRTAAAAREWRTSGSAALEQANATRAPFTTDGRFAGGRAIAWQFTARQGQQIAAAVVTGDAAVFVDLFHKDGNAAVASGTSQLIYVADRDGEFVVRVQPALAVEQPFRVEVVTQASLLFPVPSVAVSAVQSGFGAARDGGARRHEGIDIFARRGTPVVAAAGGWVTGSTTNRLGGNVVWIWSPARGIRTYYAHLDRQAVTPGTRVHAGEVIGYVGNTGNARTTPPHLHFGVYRALGGAADPVPYVCNQHCGEHLMHRRRQTAETE